MKQLRDNLPLISICLLIVGTVYLLVFYGYFGINIMPYLDLTEVFQLQFKYFLVAAAGVFSFYAYLTLVPTGGTPNPHEEAALRELEKNATDNQTENIEIEEPAVKLKVRQKPYRKPAGAGLLILVFAGFVGLWIKFRNDDAGFAHFIMWGEFIVLVVISVLVYRAFEHEFASDIKKQSSKRDLLAGAKLFIGLIVTSFAVSITARESAMQIVSDESVEEATAIFTDTTVATNRYYRYIGKTKSTIFFYDTNKQQADCYSTDELKKMEIRAGTKYWTTAK